MADKQISQLVAATTINNDDLFVMQQGGTAKKLSGQKLSDFVYQSAADQIERVDEAVEQAQAAVDSLEEQKNEIAQSIADMAQYGTDTTLSTTGVAADAKAAGDRIKAVESDALANLDQAEITGVPIATFNDGAENVPVKALTVAINPVQDLHGYDNAWLAGCGKNLFNVDGVTITANKYIDTDGDIKDSVYNSVAEGIVLTPGQTYTFSGYQDNASSTIRIATYDSSDGLLQYETATAGTNKYFSTTLTLDSQCVEVKISLPKGSQAATAKFNQLQIELGPTATSYAPYSNVCPITGWTTIKVNRTGKNLANQLVVLDNSKASWDPSAGVIKFESPVDRSENYVNLCTINKPGQYTLSYDIRHDGSSTGDGQIVVFVYTDGTTSKSVSSSSSSKTWRHVSFTSDSSKTVLCVSYGIYYSSSIYPCYLKNIQVEVGTAETTYEPYFGSIYNIALPNDAGTVYGGSLDAANGVLTVSWLGVDLSTLSWTSRYTGSVNKSLSSNLPSSYLCLNCHMLSENYKYRGSASGAAGYISDPDSKDIGILTYCPNNATDLTAASTIYIIIPINTSPTGYVCYDLKNPITYELSPTEVKTLLADNNIWANSGNILDLIYRKLPISTGEMYNTVESMIAGIEQTMEATQNYTSDKLVIAVHKLYHTTENIASGETFVPGINCYITTIADELAAFKDSVDTQLSNLSNVSTLTYEVVT